MRQTGRTKLDLVRFRHLVDRRLHRFVTRSAREHRLRIIHARNALLSVQRLSADIEIVASPRS